jgi:hypothetical protein
VSFAACGARVVGAADFDDRVAAAVDGLSEAAVFLAAVLVAALLLGVVSVALTLGDVAADPDFSAEGELLEAAVDGAVLLDDGVAGVESRSEDAFARALSVVAPCSLEPVTMADTGFCPSNSIPVTIPMARRKTATALPISLG